ncbi:MAG: hypothetical protein O2909_12855 [Chloroflexi bacterium]|nr:hypothetical protein [Chloroflexota bacterium]PKB57560.1 MAG: hypothetical protein BZY73_02520 [SAR202 cluster bacterium Casp-Chloro-G3]
MAGTTLSQATYRVSESDLEFMALDRDDIPSEFNDYQVVREGVLDNQKMATDGFTGSTAGRFQLAGRINGYMREFGPTADMPVFDGFNFVAATVVHLFDEPESVSDWMHDVFLNDFESNVGESIGTDHQLISVRRLDPAGLFDEAVALRVLQGGAAGLLSSTVIDFRVGRILGVAFVGAVGDHLRLEQATQLALALERRIVRVVLGVI